MKPIRSCCFQLPLVAGAMLAIAQTSIADSVPVAVVEVRVQSVTETLSATGTITSPQSSVLSSSVGGLIERYAVDVGDSVVIGDLLIKLDDELALLELEGGRAAERAAQSRFDDAKRRYNEAEKLAGEKSIIAATELESRRAEAAVAEASLAVATASVRQQQAIVRRHSIKAPFAGVIVERESEVGEWTSPGGALLRLVAVDHLNFDFQIPQSRFVQISKGAPVALSVDALPGLQLAGRVEAVVPVSNPGDRTFLLRVVAAADEPREKRRSITPGMSVHATLPVAAGRESVVVPRDALLRYPDGRTSIWVAEKTANDVVVHERFVRIGLEFSGSVEVSSGLEDGMLVVVRGNEALRDGQSVTLR